MKKEIMDIFKYVVAAIVLAFLIITFVFETVSVSGPSMFPTLHDGDRLIVEKVTYYFRKPKPLDIVVVKNPANTKEKYIKRVIAVAGDKFKIENHKVFVNGKELDEPYINEVMNAEIDKKYVNEITIHKGTIFVMGDNRNNSLDSRFNPPVGPIPYNLVVGRAAFRLYPFSRFGKL